MVAWKPSETERRQIVEAGGAVVANLKKDARLITWAKKTGRFVRICRPSVWGNPYVIGKDGDRQEVLKNYKKHLGGKSPLLGRLAELQGKVLGCWCYPEHCHGDELIRILILKQANAIALSGRRCAYSAARTVLALLQKE